MIALKVTSWGTECWEPRVDELMSWRVDELRELMRECWCWCSITWTKETAGDYYGSWPRFPGPGHQSEHLSPTVSPFTHHRTLSQFAIHTHTFETDTIKPQIKWSITPISFCRDYTNRSNTFHCNKIDLLLKLLLIEGPVKVHMKLSLKKFWEVVYIDRCMAELSSTIIRIICDCWFEGILRWMISVFCSSKVLFQNLKF